MHRLRVTTLIAAALAVVTVVALSSCTRKPAVESSSDTVPESSTVLDTTSLPPSTAPPSTDTTTPPVTEPDAAPDGEFGHSQAEIDAFRRIYADAFRAECTRIWAHANGDGSLADPDLGDPYYLSDCLDGLDADWAELADSNDEAHQLGLDDAQSAASDLADPLCNDAGQCWSYGD
jgi:hypothetical protein